MDSMEGRELPMELEAESKILNINLNFCKTCRKEKMGNEVCEYCLPSEEVTQEKPETKNEN